MQYTLKCLKDIPELAGIYKFYSLNSELLYLGKARNLKKRVNNYFRRDISDIKTKKLISQIKYIDIVPVGSEYEALILEAKLIKENQPKYNVIWKDDKHYLYVKITRELFPRVLFARKVEKNGDFFGPFPSATIVREILSYIRTVFPYHNQKELSKRACFYSHVGLCNPCPAEILKLPKEKQAVLTKQYRRNISNIRRLLEGKTEIVTANLKKEMTYFSRETRYEEAAAIRDRLSHFDYLIDHYTPADRYIENPKLLAEIRNSELSELNKILKPFFPTLGRLEKIECFDISNISGKLAAGSMVTFVGGHPEKKLYRRFRIRFKKTPDDFAMISEVIRRRLSHKEWKYPDLFIVDGGKPQLSVFRKALSDFGLSAAVIGLAKEYEEIVVPHLSTYIKIKLPENSKALNLVKRLRDEAHRFAHKYHSLLRLKKLISEVSS